MHFLVVVFLVCLGCHLGLAHALDLEHLQVVLQVDVLLRTVQLGQALLEELVAGRVVRRLAVRDLLRELVVPELARFRYDLNVCRGRGVHLLNDHLDLVEESKGESTFATHDLLDGLRSELDFEGVQRGGRALEVRHEVGGRVLRDE